MLQKVFSVVCAGAFLVAFAMASFRAQVVADCPTKYPNAKLGECMGENPLTKPSHCETYATGCLQTGVCMAGQYDCKTDSGDTVHVLAAKYVTTIPSGYCFMESGYGTNRCDECECWVCAEGWWYTGMEACARNDVLDRKCQANFHQPTGCKPT